MSKTTVLIIDDEIKLTQSLAFTLRQAGMICLEAHNGHTGCNLLESQSPDVVLLDIRMPGQSGIEVLEWMTAEAPDIPVIMMSAFDDTKDAVTSIKMGAVDYISKPFDIDELIHLIEGTSRRKRLESEVKYLRQRYTNDPEFIGNSHLIRTLRQQVERVTESNVTLCCCLVKLAPGKPLLPNNCT